MKKYTVILTGLCLMSAILAGCVTVKIDEDRIFTPREQHVVSLVTGLKIRDEDWLNNRYITLDHFTLPVVFGDVAVTHASSYGDDVRPLFLMCMGAHGERYRSGKRYIRRAINIGDVILFDYPGYNDSDGEPTVSDFEITAAAMSEYLREQAAKSDRKIVLWGHSLGGFVCSDIARRNDEVDALILETTAQNIDGVVDERLPKLLEPFLRPKINKGLQQYDIAESLKDFEGPVLVLGAGEDTVIGVELQRALAAQLEAQGTDVTYLENPEATHTNVPFNKDIDLEISAFLWKR